MVHQMKKIRSHNNDGPNLFFVTQFYEQVIKVLGIMQ